MATTVYPYVQYSGMWTTQQQLQAASAGTWPDGFVRGLYSWGANPSGQLGLGNTVYYSSPKQVGGLTTWLKIAAGYHSCAAIN